MGQVSDVADPASRRGPIIFATSAWASEAERESGVTERGVQRVPIEAQSAAGARATASICVEDVTWTGRGDCLWLHATTRALTFFGGVPQLIVPDNPRALVKVANRYEPQLNDTVLDFARHYGCSVLPARAHIRVGVKATPHCRRYAKQFVLETPHGWGSCKTPNRCIRVRNEPEITSRIAEA